MGGGEEAEIFNNIIIIIGKDLFTIPKVPE